MDQFSDYHIIACVEVFLERHHEVVVGVQVHVLSLQPVEPMHDVRPAGVDAGVRLLISDIVVDEFFWLQKVGEVSFIFVQRLPLLHVDPFELLVGFETVDVEMLVFPPVS